MLLDFINLIFTIILIAGAIFYFTAGERFEYFTNLIFSFFPFFIFILLFFIKQKFVLRQRNKEHADMNSEIVLSLSYFDKLLSDLVVFITPFAIGLIYFFKQGILRGIDFFVLFIIFSVMYLWQRHLFTKKQ
jgi:hypothetical protein